MSENITLKIVIAEDDVDFRCVLVNILNASEAVEVVAAVGSGEELLSLLDSRTPDIALLDIDMPGMSGIQTIQAVAQRHPAVKPVVLSAFPYPDYVEQALAYGAKGFLVKGAKVEDIIHNLRGVMAGRVPLGAEPERIVLETSTNKIKMREKYADFYSGVMGLSQRYKPLLPVLVQGLSDKEIAQSLHLSRKTVSNYVLDILVQTHCNSRTEFAFKSLVTGIVKPGETTE